MISEKEIVEIIKDCCPYINNPKATIEDLYNLSTPKRVQINIGHFWTVEQYVVESHRERLDWNLLALHNDIVSKKESCHWATIICAMHTKGGNRWTRSHAVAEGLMVLGKALDLVEVKVPTIPGDIPLFTVKGT